MRLRTLAATGAVTAAVIGGMWLTPTVANATIPTFPGPAAGWSRTWTAPASYCKTYRIHIIDEGFKVTACTLYGDSTGTGGFFDWRAYKPGEPR